MKRKGGSSSDGGRHYEGLITDAVSDGSIDYKNRPADKSKTGRWPGVAFIMGSTTIERLAFYGIAFNLVSYLTRELHEGTAESITNVWNWGGVAWLTPLVGGFIADAYLGRFKTIAISLFIYQVGMVLLTLTVALPALKPPACPTKTSCKNASQASVRLFFFALYVIAIAIGGIKPCISTLGADQFDEEDDKERPMKRSFFNYWWVAITGGAVVALTALVYIEDHVGFGWGYGIPTVGMLFSTALLLAGKRRYRYKLPHGSPLTQVAQVLVASVRKFRLQVPADAALLHETHRSEKRNLLHSNNYRFLDKAATPSAEEARKVTGSAGYSEEGNGWRLCTVTQVEEVKLLVKVLPVWVTTLMFCVTAQQLSTVFLRQGLTMDLRMGPHFQIPPASLELSCSITALIAIPVYDRYVVPVVRHCTGNERGFTLLQRIGIGLVLTVLGMAVAAIVEIKRLAMVEAHGMQLSNSALPMSVFWLTPQYSIMGLAQVCTAFPYTSSDLMLWHHVCSGRRPFLLDNDVHVILVTGLCVGCHWIPSGVRVDGHAGVFLRPGARPHAKHRHSPVPEQHRGCAFLVHHHHQHREQSHKPRRQELDSATYQPVSLGQVLLAPEHPGRHQLCPVLHRGPLVHLQASRTGFRPQEGCAPTGPPSGMILPGLMSISVVDVSSECG